MIRISTIERENIGPHVDRFLILQFLGYCGAEEVRAVYWEGGGFAGGGVERQERDGGGRGAMGGEVGLECLASGRRGRWLSRWRWGTVEEVEVVIWVDIHSLGYDVLVDVGGWRL